MSGTVTTITITITLYIKTSFIADFHTLLGWGHLLYFYVFHPYPFFTYSISYLFIYLLYHVSLFIYVVSPFSFMLSIPWLCLVSISTFFFLMINHLIVHCILYIQYIYVCIGCPIRFFFSLAFSLYAENIHCYHILRPIMTVLRSPRFLPVCWYCIDSAALGRSGTPISDHLLSNIIQIRNNFYSALT